MNNLLIRKELHNLFQEFGTRFPNLNLQNVERELAEIIRENEKNFYI